MFASFYAAKISIFYFPKHKKRKFYAFQSIKFENFLLSRMDFWIASLRFSTLAMTQSDGKDSPMSRVSRFRFVSWIWGEFCHGYAVRNIRWLALLAHRQHHSESHHPCHQQFTYCHRYKQPNQHLLSDYPCRWPCFAGIRGLVVLEKV